MEPRNAFKGRYYQILNVHPEATLEDIRNSYKKLCKIYHPDRHLDQQAKQAAQDNFSQLNQAYEVLTDAGKRAIYDIYDEAGLRAGSELATRYKSPEELRDDYLKKSKEDADSIEAKSHNSTNITVNCNLSPLFSGLKDEYGQVAMPEITKMMVECDYSVRYGDGGGGDTQHSLSNRDNLTLGAFLLTHEGTGMKSVTAAWRKHFSNRTWCDVTMATRGVLGSVELYHQLTPVHLAHIGLEYMQSSAISSNGLGLSMSLQQKLSTNATAALVFRTGSINALRAHLRYENNNIKYPVLSNTVLSYGNDVGLKTDITTSVSPWSSLKIETGINSNDGVSLWCGLQSIAANRKPKHEKKSAILDENATVVGWSVGITSYEGLSMRLELRRGQFGVNIPIILSSQWSWVLALSSCAIPLFSSVIFNSFVIVPAERHKHATEVAELREKHGDFMNQRKTEAAGAIILLKKTVERKIEIERERSGLLILHALYGHVPCIDMAKYSAKKSVSDFDSYALEANNVNITSVRNSAPNLKTLPDRDVTYICDRLVDVSVQLQYHVENSELHLPATCRAGMMGFYDPCIGETKMVYIQYLFRGKLHEVLVSDGTAIDLPMKAHATTNKDLPWFVSMYRSRTMGVNKSLEHSRTDLERSTDQ